MRINNDDYSVAISLTGGSIGITENGRITIGPNQRDKEKPRYDLGPATKANFDAIISYFNSLRIHSTD